MFAFPLQNVYWGWVEGACKASKIISREKLFHRQKIHFSLHPDHHSYSKNERLGRLPYYSVNFFSFHFASIATLNCNFPFFFIIIISFSLIIFARVLKRTHFFTAVFSAVNHCFEEAVVETGGEFFIVYIFITLFVNNLYFRVQLCF